VRLSALDLEVVWPLHKSHYLSPALADAGIDMDTESESLEETPAESQTVPSGESVAAATAGRKLAVRALLAGGCLQQRVAELLHTHRRSVGRMAEADVTAALRDAAVVEQARTCLADTAIRGSTVEEREAADAWLVHALRDERQIEQFHQRTPTRRPTVPAGAATTVKRNDVSSPVKRAAVTPAMQSAALPGAPPAMFGADQVDALTRQQQRIVHRSELLAYVIAAENRSGQALTLGDALAELLADITEAAHTIGTIVRQVGNGRSDGAQ